jgi:N-acetylglutamate synthase/N-acetylornithine aminotransferase
LVDNRGCPPLASCPLPAKEFSVLRLALLKRKSFRSNHFARILVANASRRQRGTGTAIALGMTHRNVETLIGRLITDSLFRRRFLENPRQVLSEFRQHGFELTTVENDALAGMDTVAMKAFAEAVDRRIQRVELPHDATTDQREG